MILYCTTLLFGFLCSLFFFAFGRPTYVEGLRFCCCAFCYLDYSLPEAYGRPVKVYQWPALCLTLKIDFSISLTPFLIFTGRQKVQNSTRFSTPVASEVLWCRNKGIDLECKTYTLGAQMISQCPPPAHFQNLV